jgi:hypothetical protein
MVTGGEIGDKQLRGYYALRGFCYSTILGAIGLRVGTRVLGAGGGRELLCRLHFPL